MKTKKHRKHYRLTAKRKYMLKQTAEGLLAAGMFMLLGWCPR